MRTLFRGFAIETVSTEGSSTVPPRVFRLIESDEVENPLSRRIIQLADGKSTSEITAIIYGEELRKGGWIADIGLWHGMFQRELCKAITGLAHQGYVSLEWEDQLGSQSMEESRNKYKGDRQIPIHPWLGSLDG